MPAPESADPILATWFEPASLDEVAERHGLDGPEAARLAIHERLRRLDDRIVSLGGGHLLDLHERAPGE